MHSRSPMTAMSAHLSQPLDLAREAARARQAEAKERRRAWGKFWSKMFSKMFSSRSWHRMLGRLGLTPAIVGFDLHLVAEDERQANKAVALVLPGLPCAPAGLRKALLKCLHPYVETKADELFFDSWNLTLNISSLRGSERIFISRPYLLFSLEDALDGYLRPALHVYGCADVLQNIRGGHVGGMCDKRIPQTTGDVKDICFILLQGNNGLRYHRFQRPGCPSVREMVASYGGQTIGPWCFWRSQAGDAGCTSDISVPRSCQKHHRERDKTSE